MNVSGKNVYQEGSTDLNATVRCILLHYCTIIFFLIAHFCNGGLINCAFALRFALCALRFSLCAFHFALLSASPKRTFALFLS